MSGYEITIFIPCHPSDPRSIEQAADFHLALDSMRPVTLPDDAEVGKLKWIARRKSPAQITTTSAESSAQDGAGSSDSRQTDGPAADPDKLPAFLDRKVPR